MSIFVVVTRKINLKLIVLVFYSKLCLILKILLWFCLLKYSSGWLAGCLSSSSHLSSDSSLGEASQISESSLRGVCESIGHSWKGMRIRRAFLMASLVASPWHPHDIHMASLWHPCGIPLRTPKWISEILKTMFKICRTTNEILKGVCVSKWNFSRHPLWHHYDIPSG